MPFEISPEFKPTIEPLRVGKFQKFANAMLLGCKDTYPIIGALYDTAGGACAMGALYHGAGIFDRRGRGFGGNTFSRFAPVEFAYHQRYGAQITADNDSKRFTREEIAARIAALD